MKVSVNRFATDDKENEMSPIEYLKSSKAAQVALVVLVIASLFSLGSDVHSIASVWKWVSF